MIIFSGNKYMRFLKTISYNDSMDCLHGRVTLSLPLYVMVICSAHPDKKLMNSAHKTYIFNESCILLY